MDLTEKVDLGLRIASRSEAMKDAGLPLLKAEEAAALLGVSVRTLREYTEAQLARVHVGSRGVRWRLDDLAEFSERRRRPKRLKPIRGRG